MSKLTGSKKATQFTESVIREMTRLNEMYGGVNLSQGFPDFPAPSAIKEAACAAINADVNQYAVTWGARPLREAVAREFSRRYGVRVVADEQVTVCCGSTEAMMSTMLAIIDPRTTDPTRFSPARRRATSRCASRTLRLAPARPGRTGHSIRTSSQRRSTRRRRRSSSTRRTIRREKSSRARSWKRSPRSAASGTRLPSRTRSTSTSSTTASFTSRLRRSKEWPIAP